jgi:uncharacterized membrane protein YgdD (TMEM256/DUF423 family)
VTARAAEFADAGRLTAAQQPCTTAAMTSSTSSRMLAAAAGLGAATVLLGAFAAHGLKSRLSPEQLEWWQTGVRYQAWHGFALLFCGLLARTGTPPRLSAALFLAGTALFSGSLYAMALTGATWLGVVTPFGGVALVLGWLALLPHCRKPAT